MNKTVRKNFKASGMGCAGCAARIESVLNSLPGVEKASVSFVSGRVSVECDGKKCSTEDLVKAVEDAGYGLVPDTGDEDDEAEERKEDRKLAAAAAVSAALSVLAMSANLLPEDVSGPVMATASACVVFGCGNRFFTNACNQLRHKTCSMDTLVALSAGISYLFSLFNLAFPLFWKERGIDPGLYFDSCSMVVTFVLAGRFLENRAKRRTTSAVRKLAGLKPEKVTILADGHETEIDADAVQKGTTVVAHPGERIAADGKVVSGETYIDESMITGEAVPVWKGCGSKVFAGTVNMDGHIRYSAESTGEATVLSRIIRLVRNAQDSKAPVQRLADKISSIFVPAVIITAAVSFIAWTLLDKTDGTVYGILSAVTVLVIACPCTLGLATPTAIAAGTGKGAECGILIKDAGSLEKAAGINAVALDKTGTLTVGRPEVNAAHFISNERKEQILSRLASLESLSGHPLSGAVCRYAREMIPHMKDVTTEDFRTTPGLGISGTAISHEGKKVRVNAGSFRYMSMLGVEIEDTLKAASCMTGSTEIWFAEDGLAVAVLEISDTVRDTAEEGIDMLERTGVKVLMLTGDRNEAAVPVAKKLGIADCRAGRLPDDKVAEIRGLQEAGYKVAMTGDGINDSAALAQADLGIAMGQGSDIAIDASDVTLMDTDLRKVAATLKLSRITVRTIRENLFWAFIYNAVGIPVAAGVLYPAYGFMLTPALAGLAMTLSSICVVANSLRIRFMKI